MANYGVQMRIKWRAWELRLPWFWSIVISGIIFTVSHKATADKIGWRYEGEDFSRFREVDVHASEDKGAASVFIWPGGRSGASSWYDPDRELWLLGGFDSQSTLNDLWIYKQKERRWHPVSPGKVIPPGRFHASACGVSGTMFVVYGGLGKDGLGLGDLWVYSMLNHTWLMLENVPSPSPRGQAAFWCTDTHMYVCGGVDRDPLECHMWQFSLETLTWTQLQSGSSETGEDKSVLQPSSRHGAMTWVSPDKTLLYLYGGKANHSDGVDYFSDMWSYKISTNTWTLLPGSRLPPPLADTGTPWRRFGAGTWTDPAGNLWLYGGQVLPVDDNNPSHSIIPVYLGDLWKYNVSSNTWMWMAGKNQSGEMRNFVVGGGFGFHFTPGARYGTTTWLSADGFYVFGGFAPNDPTVNYMSDLWCMKIYKSGEQEGFSLGSVLSVIIIAVILVVVFIAVAVVAIRIGGTTEESSARYSLLTETASFDH